MLKYVIVDKLVEETYYARAFLEGEGSVVKIDCRPSDALATDVRADAPIFVTEEILKRSGITTNEINKMNKSEKGNSS